MVYPAVIKRHPGVHTIFPLLCTFFPPAHNARKEPRVMNAVSVRTSTVPLTGVFGLIVVSCAKHEGSNPGTAAPLTLSPTCEGNLYLLQIVGRQSKEACSAPAAHRRRGGLLHQGLGESPGPYADGSDCCGEGDGAFEAQQGDVMVVQAESAVVARMYVLLQHLMILLCVLVDVDVMLPCR